MKIATILFQEADSLSDADLIASRAIELEAAGVDMLWVPELYSFDAVSILGFLAGRTSRVELCTGILPMYSRSPTLIGMTAATLDAVSKGRFVLGLGASGPQVIEGWHGVPYVKPVTTAREVIDICRQVWRRERVTYDGEVYKIPLPPDQGTGLGKAVKLINHPLRDSIPIFIASLGLKNVEMTAELANGWLPVLYDPDKADRVWGDALERGRSMRADTLEPLDIMAGGTAAICDADTAARIRDAERPRTALYVGGMGAKGRNFYNDVFHRYGYGEVADKMQDLYLSGHKSEAEALVPEEFLHNTMLVGDEAQVRERVLAFKESGVTCLMVNPVGPDVPTLIDKIKTWAA